MRFVFEEERPSDSPFIEKVWHVRNGRTDTFTSVASSHSEIVIARCKGKTTVTLRGPETQPTAATIPAESEYIGIVFKLGTFVPLLLPRDLMNRKDANLRVNSHGSFWLDSTIWEIPRFENADTFIERLVRADLLVHDSVVSAVLCGHPQTLSPRTVQYHFARSTGLTHKAIQQIERAQQAVALLQQGVPIIDATHQIGYYDQAHLTNSLKRFYGLTPTQIAQMPSMT